MQDESLKNELIENMKIKKIDDELFEVSFDKPRVGRLEFAAVDKKDARQQATDWLNTEGVDSAVAAWSPATPDKE